MHRQEFDRYEELDKAYSDTGHLMYKKMRLVTGTITGGRALLDFGCGQGELLGREIGLFERVVGVDVSDNALEFTREKLGGSPKAELYRYESGMPSMEGGFDWVTCLDVLEHLEDPERAVREIFALTAPGGRIIVTVPNWYDIIKVRVLRMSPFHLHAHTPWGWAAMLERAGFRMTGIRAVGFPVVGSDILARRLYFLGMCIFLTAQKP